MKHIITLFCVIQMQGFSYDFIVSDVSSLYQYHDDNCILSFNISESESGIEVVEPEPPEHVQEAMTIFQWEF